MDCIKDPPPLFFMPSAQVYVCFFIIIGDRFVNLMIFKDLNIDSESLFIMFLSCKVIFVNFVKLLLPFLWENSWGECIVLLQNIVYI